MLNIPSGNLTPQAIGAYLIIRYTNNVGPTGLHKIEEIGILFVMILDTKYIARYNNIGPIYFLPILHNIPVARVNQFDVFEYYDITNIGVFVMLYGLTIRQMHM